MLSNSVTSETPSGNKASPDSATVSFQTQPSSTAPEKTPVVQWTEDKLPYSSPVVSKVSETPVPAPDDTNVSETPAATAATAPAPAAAAAPAPDDGTTMSVTENPDPAPDDNTADITPDESVIITIQAAIRGSLVRGFYSGILVKTLKLHTLMLFVSIRLEKCY